MDVREYYAAGRARAARWHRQARRFATLARVTAARQLMRSAIWMHRCMRDRTRDGTGAWTWLKASYNAIATRGPDIIGAGAQRWADRAANKIATTRSMLHGATAPLATSLLQWCAGAQAHLRERTRRRFARHLLRAGAWLRAGPLAPASAPNQQRPATGAYRIEIAAGGWRYVAPVSVLCFAVMVALPAIANRTLINDLIFMFTMLALAQYWNLLAGYAGLVSVGQQAFVGLGGYLLFALTIHVGLDPLVAIVLAGLIAAAFALPTALVVFRLRGAYFAIGTWVMAEVYRLVFAQFRQLGGGTGTSLPPFVTNEVAGIAWVKAVFDVRTSAARDIVTYWAALGLAAGTILAVYLVQRSRHGLALAAIRDSESAAESVGVDNFRTKLKVYVVTAAGTGMVGALIYLQKARISPDAAFSVLDWTAYVIFIVVIGGIGTIEGPIVGVLVFYILQTYLSHFGSWYLILLGLFAILTMLFAPKGIWGFLSERYNLVVFPIRRRLVANASDPASNKVLRSNR